MRFSHAVSIVRFYLFYLFMMPVAVTGCFIAALLLRAPFAWKERVWVALFKGMKRWKRLMIRFFFGIRVAYRGAVPQEAPILLVPNHQSSWDSIFFMNELVAPMRAVMTDDILKVPLFSWVFVKIGVFVPTPCPPRVAEGIIKDSCRLLNEGFSMLIFPEGMRRPVGDPGEYFTGVYKIALKTGVPVVPVAHNAGLFWMDRTYYKNSGTVVVQVLEPLHAKGFTKKEFMTELKTRIDTAVSALIAEAYAKDPTLEEKVRKNARRLTEN